MITASRTPVPALGVELVTYRHACGLVHLHLACSDEHRACAIAFRTPPEDSTGLPHILEHTTLCGSVRYPVRDPFFMMMRRSLATFMNAMTYPDLTAYPFATQVPTDFTNLLGVYLDAVFAPRLDERDFRQEGHRLAPEADGTWKRQGVVFNEMQGALDNTDAQLSWAIQAALLPDTCYRHESGGDPATIPRLTHADLVAFQRRCYCPANAVVTTYGAVDIAGLHRALAGYIASRGAGATLPPPAGQPPLASGQHLRVPVPFGEGQELADVTCAGVTWCWGDTTSIDEVLAADLLERLLLGHAGSPLRRALEASGLGRGTGSSGYSGYTRNGLFSAQIDGLEPADAPKVIALVEQTLATIAADGVPGDEIEAALHQLELSRREVRGDGYPYGLELCLRLIGPWNLGADPLPFLEAGPAMERLRAVATPAWVREQVRARLVANPHRVSFEAMPDREFHARTRARVAELDRAELAEPGAEARLRAEAALLAERQAAGDDPGPLPTLALSDVPATRHWATGAPAPWDRGDLTVFTAPTNGLAHLVAALPLTIDNEPELLPLLAASLGGLGCAGRDYAAQSARINAVSGGIRTWVETGGDPNDATVARPWLLLEVKGLTTHADRFLPLLPETLAETRFDEPARLRELVEQALAALQERVGRAGSSLAVAAASRAFAGPSSLGHRLSGLGRLAWLKRTAAAIAEDAAGADAALADLGSRLARLRDRIAAAAPRAALIGDDVAAVRRSLAWPQRAMAAPARIDLPAGADPGPTAFTTATAVNFNALCFAAPPLAHPDAADLAIGAKVLTDRWLHNRLRERGGAYGGNASLGGGVFQVASYRDPRLADTYRDIRDGLRWLAEEAATETVLREAKLGVMQSLDSPGSPAGEARRRFTADLCGRGPAVVEIYRNRLLAVTADGIRAAAARWLRPDGGSAACITSPAGAQALGWTAVAV